MTPAELVIRKDALEKELMALMARGKEIAAEAIIVKEKGEKIFREIANIYERLNAQVTKEF